MQTYKKKRLEAFIEAPVLNRFADILEHHEVKGYSVQPVLAGNGKSGPWTREGVITSAGQLVCVVCILSEETLDPLLETVFKLLSRHIGIISVSDCEVLRSELF